MNIRSHISRGEFVNVAVGSSAGFFIPQLFNLIGMRSPDPKIYDQPPKPEFIHGIPVYGARSPIRDRQVLQTIAEQEESNISHKFAPLYAAGDREAIVDLRNQSFAPHARRLEVLVPNTVYRNPNLLTQDGQYPYDFVRWFLDHVAAFNQIVAAASKKRSSIPSPDDLGQFALDVTRVEVVDDRLYLETGRNPYQDPVWASDRFSRWGFDVDLRHILDFNYLFLARNSQTWESSFRLADGREVKIDSGIVAGLLVELLGAENLFPYEVRVANHKDYQPLVSFYDPYPQDMLFRHDINQISPANFALIEAAINRNRLRSRYTANSKQLEQLGLPPRATFSFSLKGQPVPFSGFSSLRRVENDELVTEPAKARGEVVYGHGYRLDRQDLEKGFPHLIANLTIADKPFPFPLPQHILKIAQRVGQSDPRFDISLTGQVQYPEKYITLNVIASDELGEYARRSGRVFAFSPIPGTDTVHVWEWKRDPELDRRDFQLTVICLLAGGIGGISLLAYLLDREGKI